MSAAPTQGDAQQGMRGQRGQVVESRGAGIEMIMRQKDRLELTEAQVNRLDEIRKESVQRRTAHQAQMAELRSKVAAGRMDRAALREQVLAMRQGAGAVQTQQRERVEAVLNDAQKEKLEQWGRQARAFRMGRQSALRGGQGQMGPGREGQALRGRQGMRGGAGLPGRAGMRGNRGGFGTGDVPAMGGRWGLDQAGPGLRPGWGPDADGRPGFRRGPGDGEGQGFGPPRGPIPR
jgi:hypothetical protein